MDLNLVFVVALALFCSESVKGNSLETSTNVTSVIASPAVLRCKYTSNVIDDLMFIRWNRHNDDGSVVALAMRRSTSKKESFLPDAPSDFTDHVRVESKVTNTSVTLDLLIDGLKCKDVGKYECQAMGISDPKTLTGESYLDITVNPGTPAFKSDELQVSVNTSFELRCEANVGQPPQVITFSYKPPGSTVYSLVREGIETAVTPVPGQCTNRAVSSLALTMTENMGGGQYMCSIKEALLGPKGEPKNFDEIVLSVYRETTTVKTTQAPSTTPRKAEVSDNNAAASMSSVSLLCGLVLAFLLTDRRTDS